jgi:hypothetical protein
MYSVRLGKLGWVVYGFTLEEATALKTAMARIGCSLEIGLQTMEG